MDPYKARKVVKVIAWIIAIVMIVTSFSFVMMLPGLFGASGSVVYAAAADEDKDLDQQMENLQKYIEFIKQNYKDDISYQQLIDGAFKGATDSLEDPYSVYFRTIKQTESFVESVTGEYSGVGLTLEMYDGKCRVVSPISGTPAEKAGIKTGDIIVKIDGVNLSAKTLEEAVSMMKGDAGTKVTLTVDRGGQALTFPLTRAVIKTSSVFYKMLDGKIGYIQITSFDEDSHIEFAKALEELKKQGIKSLIIDERSNPGGLIETALNIAKQLMPQGPIMHFQQRGKIQTITDTGSVQADFPIVLLVNEGSASASEILAGALQDSGTAKLVGTTTFGKGISQIVYEFTEATEGYGIKLSTLYFLTPNKHTIHKVGITPDYIIKNPVKDNLQELVAQYQSFAPMSEKLKPAAGSVGLNVYGAQQRLAMLGYTVKSSGTMDDETVAAVKKFQKESGLYAGGTLDYTTMNTLNNAVINFITGAKSGSDLQLEKAIQLLK